MNALDEEARRWGIAPGYHDTFGHWHASSDDATRRILDALAKDRPAPSPRADSPTPQQAYQGDGSRLWGLSVQLYAVRSARNWGIGDFQDLRDIVAIAARAGASAVGLNPLHALFLARPEMASPYAPSSRVFLNPLYIAIDVLPEFIDTPELVERRTELRARTLLDYTGVAAIKVAALQQAYQNFLASGSEVRKADLAGFIVERGEALSRFACFEVLRERFDPVPWQQWPEPWRSVDRASIDRLMRTEAEACGFVAYLQWIADRQLAACRDEAVRRQMPIGLYLDLAVGVDPSGADAWSARQSVMTGVSIGAPPDDFNSSGQNWGLAPFHPHALVDSGFSAFLAVLDANMRHAGALRLDHVMGLMRLYLIPHGFAAHEGVYVSYPLDRLLSIVAQESHRHRCVFIGEDLGTVPDGFRETTSRWGVWTYRVMMFERGPDGEFRAAQDYPAEALATFNTHDLPTFRGWMSGKDIDVRRSIGLASDDDDTVRATARELLLRTLQPFAGQNDPSSFAAMAGFLAATPSRLAMVAIEDVLEVEDQTNVPGTFDEHPNWRRILPVPLEDWAGQPMFCAVKAAFDHAGRGRYGG